MELFKKPLSAAQEKKYLQEMKEGSKEAKKLLIEHNMRLVAHVMKKYAGIEKEAEDLLSVGTIGLMKAVNTFDPRRGSRLSSYAAKCIDNEILMLLRTEKKRSREVSLYEPIGMDKEGNAIHLLNILESTKREITEEICIKEQIRAAIKGYTICLKEKEQQVLKMRYGLFGTKVYTQKEIGSRLGISRSYVSRIEKNALEKLKEYLTFHSLSEH